MSTSKTRSTAQQQALDALDQLYAYYTPALRPVAPPTGYDELPKAA